MKTSMVGGLVALTVFYNGIAYMLKDSPLTIPAEVYCPEDQPSCYRPDLFAFQIACASALFFCGITGFNTWYITRRVHTMISRTPEGRVFGYLPESERLVAVNFTFQTWNLVSSLFIEEHCTLILLVHHSIAAFVCYSSLESQYLHYYAIFFVGLSEVSSMFLVFVDIAKFFPPIPGSPFDAWVGLCGPCFVVTFFIYRVLLWWKFLYQLWSDVSYVLKRGLAEKLRPGKAYVLYLFVAVGIPMGLLQLYWFQIIVNEVIKVLSSEA